VSTDDEGAGVPPAEQAPPAEPMPPAVRWLVRLAVVAVALRFIVQGFREQWAPADGLATVLLYAAVILGVCSAGLALAELARRRGR
jgi:hypothetical protein